MVRLRFPILFVICLLALAPLRPALAQAEDVFPPVICGEWRRKTVRCWRIWLQRCRRSAPMLTPRNTIWR